MTLSVEFRNINHVSKNPNSTIRLIFRRMNLKRTSRSLNNIKCYSYGDTFSLIIGFECIHLNVGIRTMNIVAYGF